MRLLKLIVYLRLYLLPARVVSIIDTASVVYCAPRTVNMIVWPGLELNLVAGLSQGLLNFHQYETT
jgi:hypothetical protein